MGFSLGKTLGNVISGAVSGGAVGGIPGAIVGGALGGASGYLDAYQDKSALKYQNAQNVALWNMQNAYNTPKEQMARFMDAGLNPNLIYSQSNEAGAIPGGALQNNNSQIGGQIRSAQQQRLNTLSTYSSLASAQAQREYTQAQTANIGFQQELDARRLRIAEALLPYQINQMISNAEGRVLGLSAGTARNFVSEALDKSRDVGGAIGEWLGDKAYGFHKWLHIGKQLDRWLY